MTRHVAIIGAGVIGAVSAIEALRDGHRVTLIDPGEPGGEQAASYGNAGWLCPHLITPPAVPGVWRQVPGYLIDPLGPLSIRWSYFPRLLPWLVQYLVSGWTESRVQVTATALYSLLVDAPALHRRLAEEAGVADLIEHQGLLHAYRGRTDFEADAFVWRLRREAGVSWTELNGDELRQHEPMLAKNYDFGVLVEEAGRCREPGAYVAALAALARNRGADLVRATVNGLRTDDGRLTAVLTDAGDIACDAAAVCAGARSGPLAASVGDSLPLDTERGYHVEIAGLEAGPRMSVSLADRKMVVNGMNGGLRAAGQVEFADLEASPNWRRADALLHQLQAAFPSLPRDIPPARIRRWIGNRPSMPDGRPCIGHARRTRDVVHAFGHGHLGLVGAGRTGRLVAQLLGGRTPEIDLAPFDPARF